MRSACLVLIVAAAPALAQPVVENGTFDVAVPNVGTGGGWTAERNDGLGGWRSTGGNPDGVFILNDNGSTASDPLIFQDVDGFVVGQSYLITGDYRRGNLSNSGFAVAVDINDVTLFEGLPSEGWVSFESGSFVATSTTMRLTIRSEVGGDSDARIDNIAVSLVPAPGTVAALGMLGLASSRRRR